MRSARLELPPVPWAQNQNSLYIIIGSSNLNAKGTISYLNVVFKPPLNSFVMLSMRATVFAQLRFVSFPVQSECVSSCTAPWGDGHTQPSGGLGLGLGQGQGQGQG